MKYRSPLKASIVFSALAALTLGSTAALAEGHAGGGGGGHGGGGHAYGGGGRGYGGYHGGYGGYHGGYGGYHGGYGGYHGGYRGYGYGYRGGYYGGWGWGLGGLGLGLYFATLPLYYSTVWWDGIPYYYANNTYYVYDGDARQYETVAPPPGLEAQAGAEQPAGTDLIAYPKNGQTADQQSKDKFECHQWAVSQTGFDPTQGAVPNVAPGKRTDYMRAQAACLEGRGYSVK